MYKRQVLTRNPLRAQEVIGQAQAAHWDPLDGPPDASVFAGTSVIFNLAGEPVAEGRWSDDKNQRIRNSRVIGTRNLVAGIAEAAEKPKVLVSASAVGYYGDRGDEKLDEQSHAGTGFLAEVCEEWEHEAMAAEALGVRVVCVRIGIVLAEDGGALKKMLPPFTLGVGGRLGSGKQWMAWVHIDDLVGILLHCSRTESVRGAVNASSPNPATNAEFTKALGKALGRPAFLPVPKTALRVALGEMSKMLLASQRALPKAALASGYQFQHGALDDALGAALSKPGQQ